MRRTARGMLLGSLLAVTACGSGDPVEIQALPPATRPSPEARIGLPEIGGEWRFAGWEVPSRESVEDAELRPLGTLRIETQRMDSLAGYYVREEGRVPVVGEVRRDSLFSLLAEAGEMRAFLAGRVSRDTLWVELTSLEAAESWPPGTRAALARGVAGEAFVRLPGGEPLVDPAEADTLAADTGTAGTDAISIPQGAVSPARQSAPGPREAPREPPQGTNPPAVPRDTTPVPPPGPDIDIRLAPPDTSRPSTAPPDPPPA